MAQSDFTLAMVTYQSLLSNHIVVMLQASVTMTTLVASSDMVLPIGTYHTILANQISITDFW